MASERTERLVAVAFVLVNLVLKCSWLGTNVLFNDEPFTVHWSQRSLAAIGSMLATENNPPLYFLLIKVWSWAVPFEAAWLRVPSAILSSFAVLPLFLLARGIGGMRPAIIAAGLFTFSNYHYGFAHEVRSYALFTLLATTCLWLLMRSGERPRNDVRYPLGLAALNAVMVYTHFFGWLVVGLELLLVFTLPELRHRKRAVLIAAGLAILCYLPYINIFVQRMGLSVGQGTWLEPPVPEEIYNMLWRWSNRPVMVVLHLVALILALAHRGLKPVGIRLGLLWTFVPLIGMFLVSFATPIYLDRYLVFAAPGFALLVGISFHERLPRGMAGDLACALPVLGMLFSFTPWERAPRQPERVVEQVDRWCTAGCDLRVAPTWYWLNLAAAKDIRLLRGTQPHETLRRIYGKEKAGLPCILVDATGKPGGSAIPEAADLRAAGHALDSTEADHKVWVYRFAQ